jgi:hypothetical protein
MRTKYKNMAIFKFFFLFSPLLATETSKITCRLKKKSLISLFGKNKFTSQNKADSGYIVFWG